MFIIFSFFFGTLFGSFSTVLIERWKHKKSGILMGRSECPNCRHTLHAKELIPIVSYVYQKGKCSNCNTHIPLFYPLAEVIMGSIFAILTFFHLQSDGNIFDIRHIVLLVLGFVTGVYILYDMRYTEIPDQIMLPSIGIIVGIFILILSFPNYSWEDIFFQYTSYASSKEFLLSHILGAFILYTFFFLQILIPGTLYLYKKKQYHNIVGLLGMYVSFPVLMYFQKNDRDEDVLDIPTWIGGGDLRVALFIGLTLGTVHGIAAIFFAYCLGSIIALGYLFFCALAKKTHQSTIPFGPFLGCGWLTSIFFSNEIFSWWKNMYLLF